MINIKSKTTEKEMLLALKELKPIEEQARDQYAELSAKLTDKKVKKVLDFISKQEQKHADLVQEMIEIIKKSQAKH